MECAVKGCFVRVVVSGRAIAARWRVRERIQKIFVNEILQDCFVLFAPSLNLPEPTSPALPEPRSADIRHFRRDIAQLREMPKNENF